MKLPLDHISPPIAFPGSFGKPVDCTSINKKPGTTRINDYKVPTFNAVAEAWTTYYPQIYVSKKGNKEVRPVAKHAGKLFEDWRKGYFVDAGGVPGFYEYWGAYQLRQDRWDAYFAITSDNPTGGISLLPSDPISKAKVEQRGTPLNSFLSDTFLQIVDKRNCLVKKDHHDAEAKKVKRGGCWDIIASRNDAEILFCEIKNVDPSEGKNEDLRPNQIYWLQAAKNLGLTQNHFAFLNYQKPQIYKDFAEIKNNYLE